VPDWDQAGCQKIADALCVLGATLGYWSGAAGVAGEVNPIHYLIVSATGWGLNLPRDANIMPEQKGGATVYRLRARDVPVDGFWSTSLYNRTGYFQINPQVAYSINDITARRRLTAPS
jgi:hypothetical protein